MVRCWTAPANRRSGGCRSPRRTHRRRGTLEQARAPTVVDATGRYVAPGFIDVHSHAGEGLSETLNHGQPVLAQGITTVVVNPDGGGPVDIAAQRATYEKNGIGPNAAIFVPTAPSGAKFSAWPIARRRLRSSNGCWR